MLFRSLLGAEGRFSGLWGSVALDRELDVDGGEDGEDVGLQEGEQSA